MKPLNIVLVGVGGQGLITLASTLGRAAIREGTRVLVAETHGLSQRGGSVEVYVRMGDVESPLVPPGGADIIASLELIETLRGLRFAGRQTTIITDERLIRPSLPGIEVPEPGEAIEALRATGLKLVVVPAFKLAEKAGSTISSNMAMLGGMLASGLLDGYISRSSVEEVVREMPPRWREVNLKALDLGYAYVEAALGKR
jgi:indolepyruvate ferredoxin oxidoreductase beta subunit